MYKRAYNNSRNSWSIVSRTFCPGFQGEEDYDHPASKPAVPVQSSQSESWTDEYFREQVPVANPNYRKCFLAPKGYKIALQKLKKNRNRIHCNALFEGQKSPIKTVSWFCQDCWKGGDRILYIEQFWMMSAWFAINTLAYRKYILKDYPLHSWDQMWG